MDSVVDTEMTSTDLHLEIKNAAREDTGHVGAVHQETQHRTTGRLNDLYSAGYDQNSVSDINRLNHDPFTTWIVPTPEPKRESVSDLRLFAAISIPFNPLFGIAAFIQAVKAQKELEKGNIAQAKELNSIALGLAIGGIAISFFVAVAIVAEQMLYKPPAQTEH